jgi:hypothetical protein
MSNTTLQRLRPLVTSNNRRRRWAMVTVIAGFAAAVIMGALEELFPSVKDLPDLLGVIVVAPTVLAYLSILTDSALGGDAAESRLDERELARQNRMKATAWSIAIGIVQPLAIVLIVTNDHPNGLSRWATVTLALFCLIIIPILPRLVVAWDGVNPVVDDDSVAGE